MTAPWAPARYPGDSVRVEHFTKDGEIGSIRIQKYATFRVGCFLPGQWECSEGDTPKVWPGQEHWVDDKAKADTLFDKFVADAIADGWQRLEIG